MVLCTDGFGFGFGFGFSTEKADTIILGRDNTTTNIIVPRWKNRCFMEEYHKQWMMDAAVMVDDETTTQQPRERENEKENSCVNHVCRRRGGA